MSSRQQLIRDNWRYFYTYGCLAVLYTQLIAAGIPLSLFMIVGLLLSMFLVAREQIKLTREDAIEEAMNTKEATAQHIINSLKSHLL